MNNKKKPVIPFVICLAAFFSCALVCLLNVQFLKMRILQKTTEFVAAAAAKYEKDGNLYIIDSGSFRLVSMTPEGLINYTITIDKMQEYTRFYDMAVDGAGNLYVYAMEVEYDAYLTKRDTIRKYDRNGNFIKNILDIQYGETTEDRPRGFAQFGSMRCENEILTFSRSCENQVLLYTYDTFRDRLDFAVFAQGVSDYSIAKLTVKDFNNFIYSTRDGDIFEIQNRNPRLRASFNFTPDGGGIIPWDLDYDARGNILFFDMASGTIRRIGSGGNVEPVLPEDFFEAQKAQGIMPVFARFGFFEDRFAGVYGDQIWYYDGSVYRTYSEGILPLIEQIQIAVVQVSFVLGIIVFLVGIYLLFVRILNRYVSLFVKQTIAIIPLTIAAFIVLYSFTYRVMTERLNQEIFNELNLAATLSSKLINGDDIDSLQSIKDYSGEAYKRLSRVLKEIVGNNNDEWNKGYYAALYKGDHFEYWVAISSDEVNLFRLSSYFEDLVGLEEYKLFMQGRPHVGIVTAADGTWAYSEAPVYNSRGEITGVIELAMDMVSYQTRTIVERRQISIIAAFICFVILTVLTVVLSVIVKQLASVAKALANIAGGDYSQRITYQAKDELGTVSRGLNTLVTELQNRFRQIQELNESSIRFVPVQFMEHLGVTDITKMKLGDHVQRNLTILFFDIRAFSLNSEIMSARENFLFINEVLGAAGPILRKHNGFVDKFLGDAAMALFVNTGDAIRAGIELYRKLILDKKTKIRIGGDGINIGIGIHSGSVMMGIVGENERLSSTVISKNVNLASRLESLTKQTKSGMLVSRDAMNQISGSESKFNYRFIGMIRAAGVNEVVGVFDMLDALPEEIRRRRLATKKIFESGIRKYHTKDYTAALQRFEKVLEADPGDICAANCLAETHKRIKDPDLPSVFMFDKK